MKQGQTDDDGLLDDRKELKWVMMVISQRDSRSDDFLTSSRASDSNRTGNVTVVLGSANTLYSVSKEKLKMKMKFHCKYIDGSEECPAQFCT